jgi:hypothetical protein
MEQQIRMCRLEFRDRGFNEPGSCAICLAYLKSRHAIEGQSVSPTGEVSVAETERPRLGRPVRARPSTVTGNRLAPKCDGVAARLSPARNQIRLTNIDYMLKMQAVPCSREAFGEKFVIRADELEFVPRKETFDSFL